MTDDKIEGLTADLRCAVQVAWRRGAKEWARLNYPQWVEWLESCDAVIPGETIAPVRVKLSRAKGWRLPKNTVVVSRPGPWGNPFTVTVDGTRAEVVRLHRLLLGGYVCLSAKADPDKQTAHLKHAAANLQGLRGKNLACWCALDGPCHADTLLELANTPTTTANSVGTERSGVDQTIPPQTEKGS